MIVGATVMMAPHTREWWIVSWLVKVMDHSDDHVRDLYTAITRVFYPTQFLSVENIVCMRVCTSVHVQNN